MYAQLGNIIFSGLKGFDALSSKRETNFAKNEVIEGKPRLQKVGTNLEEVQLSIQFHASFCVPETEIAALEAIREAAEIVPLIGGSGEFWGNFVVQSITKDVLELGSQGNIKIAILNVSLLECEVADALAAAGLTAKFAGIGNAANAALKVVNAARIQSEAASIAKPVTRAKALATTVGNQITKAKAVASQATHYAKRAQDGLKEMRGALTEANTALTEAKEVYQSTVRMKGAFTDTQAAISATIVALEAGNIDKALTANQSLQLAVSRTSSACSEVTNITATRK
jgi:phage protein U